jgi:hypothetical protein
VREDGGGRTEDGTNLARRPVETNVDLIVELFIELEGSEKVFFRGSETRASRREGKRNTSVRFGSR